jgi:hypothetical protein
MRIYHLKDTFSVIHPVHNYEAVRHETVRFRFMHDKSGEMPHWDIIDVEDKVVATLSHESGKAGSCLVLKVPGNQDATIRHVNPLSHEWRIEYPDFAMSVKKTHVASIKNNLGIPLPVYVVHKPSGAEAGYINNNSSSVGKDFRVQVINMNSLTALSLAVGISYRDWEANLGGLANRRGSGLPI